jgi:CelD/BcsL family acetyltransferase involved in cellulose biosynthesis
LNLNIVDPLNDPRWVDLTDRCDRSSLFHTTAWLEALKRTYGYEPVVFTDAASGMPLRNALLFCRVRSWLTGNRLVGLPFSDHCEPLVDSPWALAGLLELLKQRIGPDCRYIELRPVDTPIDVPGFEAAAAFWSHSIDLRPDAGTIFASFHKNHVQRSIRRAGRSGLTLEVGRSRTLLDDFFSLYQITRRKHGVPLQPFGWFQNLVECLRERLTIYMARHEGRPAATILTARHKTTLVFKYGSMNPEYKRFGGTPHLFWKAIQEAKHEGLSTFDLGRSDVDNVGLIAFKEHLGATRSTLKYYRHPAQQRRGWFPKLASTIYSHTPARIQNSLSGRLYKHFG